MFAVPVRKPPGFTWVVEWQPEPLQSRLPIGRWFAGVVTMVTFKNVLATVGPWHARHPVTPWGTPVPEYAEFGGGLVWHWMHGAVVGMWFGGLEAAPANVCVSWHTPQSPLVG